MLAIGRRVEFLNYGGEIHCRRARGRIFRHAHSRREHARMCSRRRVHCIAAVKEYPDHALVGDGLPMLAIDRGPADGVQRRNRHEGEGVAGCKTRRAMIGKTDLARQQAEGGSEMID